MNWIQQHVLIELTKHPVRRYSQLRPDGVEGNLFLYHLDGLIKAGKVAKVEGGYGLTDGGREYVSTLSLDTGQQRRQPQILVAIMATNAQGEQLMVRWKRQPNAGLVSLPHGMMHWGESLHERAAAELAEKAGMSADLSHQRDAYIRVRNAKGEVVRHMLVHMFKADNLKEDRLDALRPDVSEVFWGDPDQPADDDFVHGFAFLHGRGNAESDANIEYL